MVTNDTTNSSGQAKYQVCKTSSHKLSSVRPEIHKPEIQKFEDEDSRIVCLIVFTLSLKFCIYSFFLREKYMFIVITFS